MSLDAFTRVVGTLSGRFLLLLGSFAVSFRLALELVGLLGVVGRAAQARFARHLLALLSSPLGMLSGLLDCLVTVLIVGSLAHHDHLPGL